MSYPYIIWTMRRTGGTTLATLLSKLSEHPKVAHEPFNRDRQFGWISQTWTDAKDPDVLRADLRGVLERRPVLKHCYELLPEAMNALLLEVAISLGYRHIVLDRRAEIDRILSLELAKITGAWGKEEAQDTYARIEQGALAMDPIPLQAAVRHMKFCQVRRRALSELFKGHRIDPHVVYFEDIYADPETGRARINNLFAFLEIDPASRANTEEMVTEALLNRGQNSSRLMQAVPNIDAARQILQAECTEHEYLFPAS